MPRSVRIAIACGVALLVCSLASAVLKFVEPGNLLGDFVFVGIVGAAFPALARRRDARTRELPFLFALGLSTVFPLIIAATLVLAFRRGLVAPFLGATVIFALLVIMAFALSRPSAKGWFDSRRPA